MDRQAAQTRCPFRPPVLAAFARRGAHAYISCARPELLRCPLLHLLVPEQRTTTNLEATRLTSSSLSERNSLFAGKATSA